MQNPSIGVHSRKSKEVPFKFKSFPGDSPVITKLMYDTERVGTSGKSVVKEAEVEN